MPHTLPLPTSERALFELINGNIPRSLGKECTQPAYVAREMARKAIDDARDKAAMDELSREIDEGCPRAEMPETEVASATTMKLEPTFTATVDADASSASMSKADAPSAIRKTKPRRESAVYEFPSAPATRSGLLTLRAELELINKEFKLSDDYLAVRDRFCSISVALNEEGFWAPRFRPQPRVRPLVAGKPMDLRLHMDHLVIDAHWLWARQFKAPYSGEYARLLDSAHPFDFKLAAEYAQENWSSEYRAEEHFCLTSRVQWQLCTTSSKEHCERHRELLNGTRIGKKRIPPLIRPIKKVIATWADSSHPIRGQEQAYADLWLAREMLGDKAAAKNVAELAGLIAGHPPLNASTALIKLKGLSKRLALDK